MSEIRQVADGLRALAKQYRAVLAAGDYLDEVANIEQVRAEALKAAESAGVQRAEAEAELVAMEARVVEAQDRLAALAADEARVAEDRKRAHAAIVAQAEATARAMVAAAESDARREEDRAKSAATTIAELDAVIVSRREAVERLTAQVDALKVQASRIAGA